MIGIVLLYFVGKAFYDLADNHQKNKWLFAILGVVSYYLGLVLGQVIIILVYELGMNGSVDDMNEIVVSLLAVPVGVLLCWGFYKILQNSWSKSAREYSDTGEILDAEMINRQADNQN